MPSRARTTSVARARPGASPRPAIRRRQVAARLAVLLVPPARRPSIARPRSATEVTCSSHDGGVMAGRGLRPAAPSAERNVRDLTEVRAHRVGRSCRVLRLDRLENAPVGEQRVPRPVGLGERLHAGFVDRVGESIDDVLEHLVVARAVHRMVERGIAVDTEFLRSDLSFHRHERRAHRRQVIAVRRVAASPRAAPRGARAPPAPRGAGPALHELVQQSAEPAAAAEEHTSAVTHLDEPWASSTASAWRRDARLTWSRDASSRSGGKAFADGKVGADDELARRSTRSSYRRVRPERAERRRVERSRHDYRNKIGLSTDPLT